MPELSVTQLNTLAQRALRDSPDLNDVWVRGEVSNLTRASSGHYYFTLKDAGGEVRCAMFRNARARLDFEPADSMQVSAFGSVDIYVQRGSYQLVVGTMRRAGVGDLYARYEELKSRLQAEGLFDGSRKRPIPPYPRTVGVVTSETGAVIHDIITTSESRFPADILLAPALVQGEKAADSIVAGIELLNRAGVDVVIVGRGGGSIEDLWPFNEEKVARAITASEAPVVSAVGHETDFTIADFVADLRAPTHTGAAALVLRERRELRSLADSMAASAGGAASSALERMSSRFAALDARLSPKGASRDLDYRSMAVDELWARLLRAVGLTIGGMESRLAVVEARISPGAALARVGSSRAELEASFGRATSLALAGVAERESSLSRLSAQLESLNPSRVLERGYGLVVGEDGRAVASVEGVAPGDAVEIRFRDGVAGAEIKEVRRDVRGGGFGDELRGRHGGAGEARGGARGGRSGPGQESGDLREGGPAEGPLQGDPGRRPEAHSEDNGDGRGPED